MKEVSDIIKKITKDLLSIFMPAVCVQCDDILVHNRILICTDCYNKIPKIEPRHLEIFLKRISKCNFEDVMIAFQFTGTIQKLMYFFKYEDYKELAVYFSDSLKEMIKNRYDIITFVPLHETKQRERGYNQSELIARHLAKSLGVEFKELIFRKVYTKSQTKLNRQQRIENVRNAFELNPFHNIKSKNILLIDDIITTGATLNACTGVLKKAQARAIDVAAIATPIDILQGKMESLDGGELIFT